MTDYLKYDPTSSYSIRKVEGWKIYINDILVREKKKLGGEALRLIKSKLYDINRVVPKLALYKLYEVPIWLEFDNKGVLCACYHPSEQWLIENDFNPEKARSVEIGNILNFMNWTLDQPAMVLHELAHAYHHIILGYENVEIKTAYERATQSGIYNSVLRYNGGFEKAYAITNEQEYFAEQTEAFFGTNDYYPFVRAELMKHDPFMYETLKKLWLV